MADDHATPTRYDLVIVGAGFAGMYMLHKARQLGLNARVLEAGSGVGGTWYWNRYPGARCDIESMQYSYQFDDALQQEWNWSEKYAPQPEILKYAEHVAERYDLSKDIQFNTRVASALYDEAAAEWTLTAEDGSATIGRFYVMATGCLSVPNGPNIKGLESFAGPIHSTGRWPKDGVDFTGKRVAVIGTGSSAIQSIPLIAEQAAQVTVFQRTPNYSIPAHNAAMDPAYADSIKARYQAFRDEARKTGPGIHAVFNPDSVLDASDEERQRRYQERWQQGGLTFMGAFGDHMLTQEGNDQAANFVKARIHETVQDPAIAEKLCPPNLIGAKRLCVDTNYYATYNRPNVALVDIRATPIEEAFAMAVHAGGEVYEVDIIVLATGFDAMTGALLAVDIRGVGGASLRERWAAGPSSYLGLAMTDFPNLFTVTGPGSPSVFTNMIPTIEQHVDWIADCIAYMEARNYRSIEADPDAETAWWDHVQDMGEVGLKGSVDSWYVGANISGKARSMMPYMGGFPLYCEKCEEIAADGYTGFAFG
jgi:cation diffusion facilitator CzcD-associated flavoprotein CzcO